MTTSPAARSPRSNSTPRDRNGTSARESGAAAIGKAFRILGVFSAERPWWTLSEIAAACGMPISTTSRLLGALDRAGAVRRDRASHRYSIGARVLPWARIAQMTLAVHQELRQSLEQLVAATGETSAAYVRQGKDRICIDVIHSSQPVHRVIPLGDISPLTSGTGGRAIAAYLTEAEQRAAGFETSEIELLRRVRAMGLNCGYGDRLKHSWSVSSPIKNERGEATSSLAVTGPISRFRDTLFAELGPIVRSAALECSRRCGAPPEALHEYSVPLTDLVVFGAPPPPAGTESSGVTSVTRVTR
jgi:DNA-binding IclR family transcriptional regulator